MMYFLVLLLSPLSPRSAVFEFRNDSPPLYLWSWDMADIQERLGVTLEDGVEVENGVRLRKSFK